MGDGVVECFLVMYWLLVLLCWIVCEVKMGQVGVVIVFCGWI